MATKKYLDYAGVELLWSKVKSNASTEASTALKSAKDYADEQVSTAIATEVSDRNSAISEARTALLGDENYVGTIKGAYEEASKAASAGSVGIEEEASKRASAFTSSDARVEAAEDKITTLNGGKEVSGSVASSVASAYAAAESLVSTEASNRASAVTEEASKRASAITAESSTRASLFTSSDAEIADIKEAASNSASDLASKLASVETKASTWASTNADAIGKEASDRASAITSAVNALDATVGDATVQSGKHVAVQVVETDGVITAVTVSEDDIASAATLATLVGDDTGKSARTIANEELAKQLIPEGAKESLDTLKEIADWIQSHPEEASAMNTSIQALETKTELGTHEVDGQQVEYTTVKAYVEAKIAEVNGDASALEGRVDTLEEKVGASTDDASAEGTLYARIAQEIADRAAAISSAEAVMAEISSSVTKEAADRASAITSAVNALDATVSQDGTVENGTGLSLEVVETDGKLTSVSGSINTITTEELNALLK